MRNKSKPQVRKGRSGRRPTGAAPDLEDGVGLPSKQMARKAALRLSEAPPAAP